MFVNATLDVMSSIWPEVGFFLYARMVVWSGTNAPKLIVRLELPLYVSQSIVKPMPPSDVMFFSGILILAGPSLVSEGASNCWHVAELSAMAAFATAVSVPAGEATVFIFTVSAYGWVELTCIEP